MATLEQLTTALKAADQAGDTPAATRLAAEIRKMQSAAPAPGPKVGLGEDVARAVPSGLKRGTEALVGTAEDTGQFGGRVASRIAKWLGADPETVAGIESGGAQAISGALNPIGSIAKTVRDVGGPDLSRLYAPSSGTVKQDVEAAVPALKSVNYDPQTRLGKFAQTGAEFLPGMVAGPAGVRNIARRAGEQFLTGEASELGGQLTEGTAYEPWARLAGGLGGAASMSGLVRKGPPTEAAQSLMGQDIPLTAGQATGSRGLKYAESELGGGTTQALIDRQRDAYTARAMQEIGAPAGSLATPENMLREYRRIGGDFNRIEAAVGDVPVPPQAQQGMLDAIDNYNSVVGPNGRAPIVADTVRDIGALMRANGGPTLNGPQLAALRTRLRTAAESADPQTAQAIHAIQEQVDHSIGNHLGTTNPELGREWANARQQYRLYLDLERGLANGPAGAAAEGQILPTALRGGVKGVEGNRRLVQGQSEFTDLANEGATAMSPMPESGTSARLGSRVAAGLVGAGEPMSAVTSLAAPWGIGRVLMSQPVQRMLMSAPENARAALTALIAANQTRDRRARPNG